MADRSDDQADITINDYRAKITAFFAERQIAVTAFNITCAETRDAYREYTDAAINMILDATVRDGQDPEMQHPQK